MSEWAMPFRVWTTAERHSKLQNEIRHYVGQGYRIVYQSETTAQLVRPKHFSWFWFVMNVLWLFGWILYLIYYWAKRDQSLYLEIGAHGRIMRRWS